MFYFAPFRRTFLCVNPKVANPILIGLLWVYAEKNYRLSHGSGVIGTLGGLQ